jgi:hypothetical protein
LELVFAAFCLPPDSTVKPVGDKTTFLPEIYFKQFEKVGLFVNRIDADIMVEPESAMKVVMLL